MNKTEKPARGRPPKRTRGVHSVKGVMVHLPPDMIDALDRATEAEGLDSRSEVIRRACASYLRRAEKRLGETAREQPA